MSEILGFFHLDVWSWNTFKNPSSEAQIILCTSHLKVIIFYESAVWCSKYYWTRRLKLALFYEQLMLEVRRRLHILGLRIIHLLQVGFKPTFVHTLKTRNQNQLASSCVWCCVPGWKIKNVRPWLGEKSFHYISGKFSNMSSRSPTLFNCLWHCSAKKYSFLCWSTYADICHFDSLKNNWWLYFCCGGLKLMNHVGELRVTPEGMMRKLVFRTVNGWTIFALVFFGLHVVIGLLMSIDLYSPLENFVTYWTLEYVVAMSYSSRSWFPFTARHIEPARRPCNHIHGIRCRF